MKDPFKRGWVKIRIPSELPGQLPCIDPSSQGITQSSIEEIVLKKLELSAYSRLSGREEPSELEYTETDLRDFLAAEIIKDYIVIDSDRTSMRASISLPLISTKEVERLEEKGEMVAHKLRCSKNENSQLLKKMEVIKQNQAKRFKIVCGLTTVLMAISAYFFIWH